MSLDGSIPGNDLEATLDARRVLGLIDNELDIDLGEMDPTESLSEAGVDSLSIAMIAEIIESETGVNLPDELMGSWMTVGDVLASLRGRV